MNKKPKKIYQNFYDLLQQNNIPSFYIELENFFVYKGKLYEYSQNSSYPITTEYIEKLTGCDNKLAKTVYSIIANSLEKYIPGPLENYFKKFNLFLLKNGAVFSGLPLLNYNSYVYCPDKDKILFLTYENKVVPFTIENLNSELVFDDLPILDERTFYSMYSSILKAKKRLKPIYKLELEILLWREFQQLENHSNNTQNFIIAGKPEETLRAQNREKDLVKKLNLLITAFIELFQKYIENKLSKKQPYKLSDICNLKELCMKKAEEICTNSDEGVKNIIENYILQLYLNYAREYLKKFESLAYIEDPLLSLPFKENLVIALFGNKFYGNFYAIEELARLTANISGKTPNKTKLHIVLYKSDQERSTIIKLLKALFKVHEKKNYNFNRLPFTLKKMIELHEKDVKINVIHQFSSVKFYYKILDNLFNNNVIKNADKSILNNIHYVCFSRSLSVANKLKDFYKADIVTLANFSLKEIPNHIDENILNDLNQLGVSLYHSRSDSKTVIDEFLNKYTQKTKNSYVLAAMLIDSLKLYIATIFPGMHIKNYINPICNYIGSKNCYSRKHFSDDEIQQLPKLYKDRLNASKRKNPRRFSGISFDFEAFCRDFNIRMPY